MSIKKVGILNFQYSNHNYGAVLQAAALEFILKNKRFDVEHIDFIPIGRPSWKNRLKEVLKRIGLIKSSPRKSPGNIEAFEKFRSKFITRSKKIKGRKQLFCLSAKYQVVVVGSDQVWRPRIATDAEAFFLKHMHKDVLRVSYAASFGSDKWEPKLNEKITKTGMKELRKFKLISCRETSGVEICKNTFGVGAVHVLDPLLQVSDAFINNIIIEKKAYEKKKLVYYKLDQNQPFINVLKKLEVAYNCEAHDIYRKNGELDLYEEVDQWLRYLYESEIIITDSFHCICLGIRFDKTVIYCPNISRGQARIEDLIKYLGLSKEKISIDGAEIELFKITSSESTADMLEELRQDSERFISQI